MLVATSLERMSSNRYRNGLILESKRKLAIPVAYALILCHSRGMFDVVVFYRLR